MLNMCSRERDSITIYAGILITEFKKNMVLKEHHSGTNISQMVALRTNREILWDFTIQHDIKIEA